MRVSIRTDCFRLIAMQLSRSLPRRSMTFSKIARFAILGVALSTAGTPAIAQYQELDVEPGAADVRAEYSWSVRVTDGDVVLAGGVPYLSVGEALRGRAGDGAIDQMEIAEGAPRGFFIDATTALKASSLLSDGAVTYADGSWVVSGMLRADADRAALEEVLGRRTAAGEPWVVELDAPEVIATEPAPDGDLASAVERVLELSDAEPEAAMEIPGAQEQEITPEDEASEGEETVGPADGAGGMPEEQEPEIVPAEPDPAYAFSAEIVGEGLVFSGQVPDARTRILAGNMTEGLDGVADLVVAEGAPDDFTETAFAGIAALEHLDSGKVSLAEGNWRLEGTAGSEADSRAALERLGGDDHWTVEIGAPAAIEICRERVGAYMADRSILFGSGSARIAAESQADLASLAEIFAVCPSAPVYVEGHTDADGGAEANLILSLSRAETVVDALVELGIDPQRLYAVGYGASLPIASNATAAGKAQNRRIVFSFEDAAGTEGDEE